MEIKEKLSFAVMIKKNGEPFLTVKTTDGQFDHSYFIMNWLTNIVYIPNKHARNMLKDLNANGELSEENLNLLISCLMEKMMCYGYKKYGVTPSDERTLLSFVKAVGCEENLIELYKTRIKVLNNSLLSKSERRKDKFTFNREFMDYLLKGSDSYAIINVTKDGCVKLEDLMFFYGLTFDQKLSHFIKDPYDFQEVLESYASNCDKLELFTLIKALLKDEESESFSVHEDKFIDNARCIFSTSKKDNYKEKDLLKPSSSKNDGQYDHFTKSRLLGPGTESRGIYFNLKDKNANIEFYIDNVLREDGNGVTYF